MKRRLVLSYGVMTFYRTTVIHTIVVTTSKLENKPEIIYWTDGYLKIVSGGVGY